MCATLAGKGDGVKNQAASGVNRAVLSGRVEQVIRTPYGSIHRLSSGDLQKVLRIQRSFATAMPEFHGMAALCCGCDALGFEMSKTEHVQKTKLSSEKLDDWSILM